MTSPVQAEARIGRIGAHYVQTEGAVDKFVFQSATHWIDRAGAKSVVFKGDSEPALQDLNSAIAEKRTEPTRCRVTPKESKCSLGHDERADKLIDGRHRTVRMETEERNGVNIRSGHVLCQWLVRHVSWEWVPFQLHKSDGMNCHRLFFGKSYLDRILELCGTPEYKLPGEMVESAKKRWAPAGYT